MSDEVPDDFADFDATLSLDDPLRDYQKLVDTKLDLCSEEPYRYLFTEVWTKIAEAACDCVWKLLFDTTNPTKDQMDKASDLLAQIKSDGAMYNNPFIYNEWVYKFRDELLKKEQLDFWKNEVVAKELGPSWARDSDMFVDYEDPEPVNFYNHAGCEAAWLKEESDKPTAPTPLDNSDDTPLSLKKLTKANALEDYMHNMVVQAAIDVDDKQTYAKIFTEVREILWQLLFSETTLSEEASKMAAELLWQYKLDACHFSPHDYNVWIIEVRDELFKRKYMDFWKIIVKKRMGLCWYKDSNHFDDEQDTKPLEFYKSGDELMKQ